MRLVAPLVVALALVLAPAAWAPPDRGTFVPGRSLGGVELGMAKAEVLSAWGSKHGVCRDCARPTWYFNLKPFEPQGAGVEFRRGLVSRAFTVWRPLGWRTDDGLELGVKTGELREAVPGLGTRSCDGYTAYLDAGRDGPTSVYYVFRGRLWGFALMRPGLSPCL